MHLSEGGGGIEERKNVYEVLICTFIFIEYINVFIHLPNPENFVSIACFLEVNLHTATLLMSGHCKIHTQVGLAWEPSLRPNTPGLHICAPVPYLHPAGL